ncbi:MAG: choice-of-anchor A family protein [Rhodospirillales bacterium]|nr:choice-of-anchor A family protein [Acetobacter sp.]
MKCLRDTLLLGCVLTSLGSASSIAAPYSASDILGGFNAVIYGNFSSNSDVEGQLAVGGNMNGGATFNINPSPTPAALSNFGAVNVVGNVATGTYNVNNGGDVYVGGTTTAIFNLNGGGTLTNTSSFTLPDLSSSLNALSAQLTGLDPTGNFPTSATPGYPNNVPINATPDADGIAVIDVTTSQLSSLASFQVNLNGASTVIFNVTGTSWSDTANFLNESSVNTAIIWNFIDATSLDFQREFGGVVLAPLADVTNNTPIEGVLVANNFAGGGELHSRPFTGRLPSAPDSPVPIPEPASFALLGAGLFALGMIKRVCSAA